MIRSLALFFGTLALVALAKPSASPSAPPSAAVQPSASPPLQLRSARPPNAKSSPNAAPAAFDLGVWTVHASSLDANFKTGDFSTPAKVVMTRIGGDVTADRANGNYKKQVLYLNGHVVMHDSSGGAGSLAGGGGDTHQSSPSTLTADKAQIEGQAKLYKAIGNVHYVQADTNVTADDGTLDDAAHTLFLQGNVHVVAGTRKLDAGSVLYNTATGTAHAESNVTIQFPSEFHRKLATPRPLKIPGPP